MFSTISLAIGFALTTFVIALVMICREWSGFIMKNSTLCSYPWRDGNIYSCIFQLYPKWIGNMLYVFKGLTQRLDTPDINVVVKTFRHVDAKEAGSWAHYTRACQLGRDMAGHFNSHLADTGYAHRVWFVTPAEVVMDDISILMPASRFIMRFQKSFSEDEHVIFEDYLHGDFKTFITSTGSTYEIGSDILGSFSHFVYQQSGRQQVLGNLKGVFKDNAFRLTCPTVHSRSGTFGEEDRGEAGLRDFFSNHKCTPICQDFIKLNHNEPHWM